MHAYPIYANFGDDALDPDTVPFATALTAALSGKPAMMEEFGACTAPPGSETTSWQWQTEYQAWDQVMLSEETLADHLAEVLPRLVEVGSTGAMVWCYADYHEDLWDRPPCDNQLHERHFGLVRPDGSLKPHAEVIREFIASGPRHRGALGAGPHRGRRRGLLRGSGRGRARPVPRPSRRGR